MLQRRSSGLRISFALASVALAPACAGPALLPDAGAPRTALLGSDPPCPPADVPRTGELLTYGIRVAGLPVGGATLSTRSDAESTRVELTGETNRLVDVFYDVRGVARTRLDAAGRPRSFYLRVDEDGKANERSLAFHEVPCLYYHPWNEEAWVAELTQFKTPRDPLSLLCELRRLAPTTEPCDFEVAMTLRSFCYRARFLGRDDVSVGAGDFGGALLWRVEVRPYRELGETVDVGPMVGFYDVAVSADARRLPLRVTREFGFGSFALELEEVGTAGEELTADAVAAR